MAGRVERIGNCTLILGDNRVVDLPACDALIGDPPYGQRHKTNICGAGAQRNYRVGIAGGERVLAENARVRNGVLRGTGRVTVWPDAIAGDDEDFDPTPWLQVAPRTLLWGAHKFADRLPAGRWLVWDKVPTGKVRDQGDGEAAWVNEPGPLRIYRLLWDGVCVGAAARHEVTAGQSRVHPMQKPVAVMSFCIDQMGLASGATILDPWMGSGSTGVAAVLAGHPFVGVEMVPQFFETACRRIEAAHRQRDLFVAPAREPAPTQSAMFGGADV